MYIEIRKIYELNNMKYTKNQKALGLGPLERQRLSQLLRATQTTLSVTEAAKVWGMERLQAAKILSWYQKKGWVRRIARGVYIAVPLDAESVDVVPEEPFVIAEKLFAPCYVGGANAASYWDLTEQIFNTITVMTEKKVMNRRQKIAGTTYVLHTIKPNYLFGLKSVWFGDVKVSISDPTRTLLDMMMYPQFCGGARFIDSVLKNYFNSEHKDANLLISYLQKMTNGAAIKRLGYLVEKNFPDQVELIEFCLDRLTQGYVKLSPSLNCSRIVTRWRLQVPESWKEG